jgi:hypothetical protein
MHRGGKEGRKGRGGEGRAIFGAKAVMRHRSGIPPRAGRASSPTGSRSGPHSSPLPPAV